MELVTLFSVDSRLLQLCQRTMALPVGRGLFTLFSYHPVLTEPLPVPNLNLTGDKQKNPSVFKMVFLTEELDCS